MESITVLSNDLLSMPESFYGDGFSFQIETKKLIVYFTI